MKKDYKNKAMGAEKEKEERIKVRFFYPAQGNIPAMVIEAETKEEADEEYKRRVKELRNKES